MTPRKYPLPEIHRDPAWLEKEAVLVRHDVAARTKLLHLVLQRLGNSHRAAVLPERRIVPLRGVVVQHQEIAHALELEVHEAVEFVRVRRFERAIGKQLEQIRDRHVDEMNAGRLERLEKPARKPNGDAVAIPRALPAPRGELENARLGKQLTFDIAPESRCCLVVADELAAVDIA